MTPPNEDEARRLHALEEATLYAERRGDDLTEEIRELTRRLRELASRVDGLERALGRLVSSDAPEPPGSGDA